MPKNYISSGKTKKKFSRTRNSSGNKDDLQPSIKSLIKLVNPAWPATKSFLTTMGLQLEAVQAKSLEYKMLKKYVMRSEAVTSEDFQTMTLKQIFRVSRQAERDAYKEFAHLDSKLLWRGIQQQRYARNLAEGMRIYTSPGPNGAAFGLGLYFADMAHYAASYCFPTKNKTAILMACQVATGKCDVLSKREVKLGPAPGCHSVKALGPLTPDPTEDVLLPDKMTIPLGHIIPQETETGTDGNEFVIYNAAQAKIRYLAVVNFNR